MKNQAYTWSNMQSSPTLAKLDRFLISIDWDQQFPLSAVEAMPKLTLDHYPILLSTGSTTKCRMFRLEEVWLRNENFVKSIPGWWTKIQRNDSAFLFFSTKLRHCRKQIRRWCTSNFYSILKSKYEVIQEIQKIDLLEEESSLAADLLERRAALKARLSLILKNEEGLWKLQAKQHWLKERDGNTKFFDAIANGRRRSNEIGVIVDEGNRFIKEADKQHYFWRKFKELYNPKPHTPDSVGDWSGLFQTRRLTKPDLLTNPFDLDKIKTIMFQLEGDKAPRPDGFPLSYY